ncbi:MAG: enoyl-CoA hydratase, partial [Burkholderiaceae bacterium]
HDLRAQGQPQLGRDLPVLSTWGGFGLPGSEGGFAREQEIYLQMTRRWRNLSKPTIAQVQGKCIAGGLMLAWACDLICASDDAEFSDPAVALGNLGVEWFVHPWELGIRKAKEMLFTGDTWSAHDAERFGMVNRIFPRAALADGVLAIARRIASKPSFALKMAKEAVNRSVDAMGQQVAIDQSFGLHQLCHAHNLLRFGQRVDPSGLPPALQARPTRE